MVVDSLIKAVADSSRPHFEKHCVIGVVAFGWEQMGCFLGPSCCGAARHFIGSDLVWNTVGEGSNWRLTSLPESTTLQQHLEVIPDPIELGKYNRAKVLSMENKGPGKFYLKVKDAAE
jgi:hypothetical protein